MKYVVDASVVLAAILGERGGRLEEPLLANALISAVNLSEVVRRLVDGEMSLQQAEVECAFFKFEVVPFDFVQAFEAARLRPLTRHNGTSFADRACLALALLRNLPVLTADKRWSEVDVGAEVRQIR